MFRVPKSPAHLSRRKLSDQVVDRVKSWLMAKSMQPGDRLPQEKELLDLLGVSRSTLREALKSLEVQGIIRVSAGRSGGPSVCEVPYETAANLLTNYFYFKKLQADEIYAMRRLLEPEMAATAVAHMRDEDLDRLEELIEACRNPEDSPEGRRSQRLLELEFHNVIARRSPNALLSFNCQFINMILAQQVTIKKVYLIRQDKIDRENDDAHVELLAAFRAGDAAHVREAMVRHMGECSCHLNDLEAVVHQRFGDAVADGPIPDFTR